ncbi:hypothetical protein B0H19DRAFT_1271117 [Mycena capillaripes]|nr:hypothetical protein B0H19DRAFT_1271117 [Mycena capillaripes]
MTPLSACPRWMPLLIATDARRSPVHQREALKAKAKKDAKALGTDEICVAVAFYGAWNPPLASFRLLTPVFEAEFTPEEFTNLVRILDDGADSMFALRSFQFVRDRSASTDGSDGLMGTQYRPRSFLHSVRPMEFTDYLRCISAPLLHPPPLMYSRTSSTALIPAGVSTPARAAHLSLAPASPPTAAIARCTQMPGARGTSGIYYDAAYLHYTAQRPESKRVPCPFYIQL